MSTKFRDLSIAARFKWNPQQSPTEVATKTSLTSYIYPDGTVVSIAPDSPLQDAIIHPFTASQTLPKHDSSPPPMSNLERNEK